MVFLIMWVTDSAAAICRLIGVKQGCVPLSKVWRRSFQEMNKKS